MPYASAISFEHSVASAQARSCGILRAFGALEPPLELELEFSGLQFQLAQIATNCCDPVMESVLDSLVRAGCLPCGAVCIG
jgi:hypothetical protein